MKTKTCIKCGTIKSIHLFYKHSKMADGYLNECIECTKNRVKKSSRNIKKNCLICGKEFGTCIQEIKRGGGKVCSRDCYYERSRRIIKRGKESPSWKGDKVSKNTIHRRLEKKLGKPKLCEFCRTTDKNKLYDWANKSGKYLEDPKDWIRLCRQCHAKYDYPVRIKKYYEALRKNPYFNFKYSKLRK